MNQLSDTCASIDCASRSTLLLAGVALCAGHRAELAAVLHPSATPSSPDEYRSIVYYVTWDRGETVKIGTTTNPKSRFGSLRSQFGPIALLVAHPGSYDEEQVNHHRFRRLRVRGQREVFRQGPELVDHIANVKIAWPNWKQIVDEVAWGKRGKSGKRGQSIYSVTNPQ